MTVELRYNEAKQFVDARVTGALTLETYRQAMERLTTSDRFPPDVRTLWDLRELDFRPVDRGFEERLIEIRKQFPQRGKTRIAFVVADDLGFGMTRMFEMLSADLPQTTRIFRNVDAAEEWLLEP